MPFSTCRTSWLIPPSNDADGVGAASSPLVRGSRKCNSAMRGIEKRRRVVADDSHHRGRGDLHQRSARPRSPQQQVEHVHLLMVIRLIVQQVEQQRQLEFLLPGNRGRRGAVPTHRQRVRGVHPSCHTRWAPEAAARIASRAVLGGFSFFLYESRSTLSEPRQRSILQLSDTRLRV